MVFTTSSSPNPRRPIFFSLLFLLSFSLIFLLFDTFPHAQLIDVIQSQAQSSLPSLPAPMIRERVKPPRWLEPIRRTHQGPLKVGLVNLKDRSEELFKNDQFIDSIVSIDLKPLSPKLTWKKLFPDWIDENKKPQCPSIPMPEPGRYYGIDVVVTQLPCKENNIDNNRTSRGVHRLQVSLATANLIVENADEGGEKDVYAVFVGKCEPMVEIFRCDDLVWHEGEYWVYKPNVEKLREKVNMPVGTCDLARPHIASPGSRQLEQARVDNNQRPRHAYVTLLHSSEDYVCGAIALAQSIRQTNSTKDLVLLADTFISDHSIHGLQAAGWKIKRIERIRCPHAQVGAYNEWNYSKLRVWQLTEYDKVVFIDADLIVLHNTDHFFHYPQLSAAPNHEWIFNSGIMILEPSECFFKTLMDKRYIIESYNGGDQGYLNEVITWWHGLTRRISCMKVFSNINVTNRSVPKDRFTIHYFGWKPWTCYRDYDCNWDRVGRNIYASDALNLRWWQVYDTMSIELQAYCGMTQEMDRRVREERERAQKAKLSNGHWKINIKDPRQFHLVGSV